MGVRIPSLAVLAGIGAIVVAAAPVRADDPSRHFEKARIPHQDRSGRATLVEIEPGVPGAQQFLAATPEAIPSLGQLITPPPPTPLPSPPLAPRPGS